MLKHLAVFKRRHSHPSMPKHNSSSMPRTGTCDIDLSAFAFDMDEEETVPTRGCILHSAWTEAEAELARNRPVLECRNLPEEVELPELELDVAATPCSIHHVPMDIIKARNPARKESYCSAHIETPTTVDMYHFWSKVPSPRAGKLSRSEFPSVQASLQV